MYIASERLGKSIRWNYQLEKEQTVPETTAFIVVEHAPPGLPNLSCSKFPASNNITFSNIVIEVAGKIVYVARTRFSFFLGRRKIRVSADGCSGFPPTMAA